MVVLVKSKSAGLGLAEDLRPEAAFGQEAEVAVEPGFVACLLGVQGFVVCLSGAQVLLLLEELPVEEVSCICVHRILHGTHHRTPIRKDCFQKS